MMMRDLPFLLLSLWKIPPRSSGQSSDTAAWKGARAAEETAVTGMGVGETSETCRGSTGIPSMSVLLSVQTGFPVGVTYKMAASEWRHDGSR